MFSLSWGLGAQISWSSPTLVLTSRSNALNRDFLLNGVNLASFPGEWNVFDDWKDPHNLTPSSSPQTPHSHLLSMFPPNSNRLTVLFRVYDPLVRMEPRIAHFPLVNILGRSHTLSLASEHLILCYLLLNSLFCTFGGVILPQSPWLLNTNSCRFYGLLGSSHLSFKNFNISS